MPSVLDRFVAESEAAARERLKDWEKNHTLALIGVRTTSAELRRWRLEGYPSQEVEKLFRQDFSEPLAPSFRGGIHAPEPRHIQTVARERARRAEMRRFREAAHQEAPKPRLTRAEARTLVEARRRVIKVVEEAERANEKAYLPPLPVNPDAVELPGLDFNGKQVATPEPAAAPKPAPAKIPMERLSPETLPLFPELAPVPAKRRTARSR